MDNLILIGMPGAGKSTIGVILAKYLKKDFVDTDLLIQNRYQQSLQDILDRHGHLKLRELEEKEIMLLDATNAVIATGGSAVYSEKAVSHLKKSGKLIYLKLEINEIRRRIHDFDTRGIAKAADQTFEDLFEEREILYRKYGEIVVDCMNKQHETIVDEILRAV